MSPWIHQRFEWVASAVCVTILWTGVIEARAANANLFVSAEKPQFDNTFSGSMIVEVTVVDSNVNDVDKPLDEPDVTVNGDTLRMVQGSDGVWYAYFAAFDAARVADGIAGSGDGEGEGLDFGVFCGRNTPSSLFGASFSDAAAVAVPVSSGITGLLGLYE